MVRRLEEWYVTQCDRLADYLISKIDNRRRRPRGE